MTLANTLSRTDPSFTPALPEAPEDLARPVPPAVPAPTVGATAAHAVSPAWAAPLNAIGTPEAFVETCLARANGRVGDPAARLARALCVLVSCAMTRPAMMRELTPRFASTAAAWSLGEDIVEGQFLGRFAPGATEAYTLTAIGIASLAIQRTLLKGPGVMVILLARDLAFALLRALDLPAPLAHRLAMEAAREIFILPDPTKL